MRAIVSAAVAWAALCVLPGTARAVIVDGGNILTDGSSTTVDLFYYTLSQAGSFSPGLDELYQNPPPVSHPAIKLYSASGPTPGTLVASADATTAGLVSLNAMLGAGNYIMAVSEYNLAAGNFGPLNPNAVNKIGYQFEFGISGVEAQYITPTCDYSGNLNGTFTLTSGVPSCTNQPTLPTYRPAIPEPASMTLLALGLIGFAALHIRLKAASPQRVGRGRS